MNAADIGIGVPASYIQDQRKDKHNQNVYILFAFVALGFSGNIVLLLLKKEPFKAALLRSGIVRACAAIYFCFLPCSRARLA